MTDAAAAPAPAAAAPAAAGPAAAAPAPAAAVAAPVAAPVADAKAAAPVFADTPPNPTLYVHNINEKLKLAELKKSLYHVFNQFGNILEVQAKKTYKMRGQAWIVFEDLSGATKALKDMNNFNFYGKPMKVSFAKAKSDVIAKADGSYVARPKRKPDLKDKASKKRKDGESKKRKTEDDADDDEKKPAEKKRKTEASNGNAANGGDGSAVPASHAAAYNALQATMEATPPNRILFVENLPPDAIQTMLAMLFQQYPGYQEARMVPGKPGIAFVEFMDAYTAGNAMNALQNFKITATHLMKISYARQ